MLGKEDRLNHVIGKMFGTIDDRVNSQQINREIVDALYKDWTENGNNRNIKFVRMSATEDSEQRRTLFKLMPKDMREYSKQKFGGDYVYVREDQMRTYFGFRKLSLTAKLPAKMRPYTKLFSRMLRELIHYTKQKMIIANPEVMFGNYMSNMIIHGIEGVPPDYILRESANAMAGMRKYVKDKADFRKLQLDISTNSVKNPKEAQARLAHLQKELEINPVGRLVQDGLFTSIVTEADPSEYSENERPIASFMKKHVDPWLPTVAKDTANEFFMMEGSQAFQATLTATQMTDFVSRYIKVKYDTEVKKVPYEDAVFDALETFIYYEQPQHPLLQYFNDLGLLMFTKFYLRIQRVNAKLLIKRPAHTTAFMALDQMTGDTPDDTFEYFMDMGLPVNRFNPVPITDMDVIMDTNLLTWMKLIWPGTD
jgi:hypothetical protein